MNKQDRDKLIAEMFHSVGSQEPIDFFKNLTVVFGELFEKIDKLEAEVKKCKINSALAINWDPKIASDLISKKIEEMRAIDKEAYKTEIEALKSKYNSKFIQPEPFVEFWENTLGYHPFLDYE